MMEPKGWDIKLKRCPFCGGEGRLWRDSFLGRWFVSWVVRCENDGLKRIGE